MTVINPTPTLPGWEGFKNIKSLPFRGRFRGGGYA